MTRKSLLQHLRTKGVVLARNFRPIRDILGMSEFVSAFTLREHPEYYVLRGYIYGRPILEKVDLPKRKK